MASPRRATHVLERVIRPPVDRLLLTRDRDYAVGAGLAMLKLRHLVSEEDGLYRGAPGESALLAYYANSIAHLLAR